jgi:hypothetical protein
VNVACVGSIQVREPHCFLSKLLHVQMTMRLVFFGLRANEFMHSALLVYYQDVAWPLETRERLLWPITSILAAPISRGECRVDPKKIGPRKN